MSGHGEKLSRRQELAIAALLTQPTVEAAAAAAGVSSRTLHGWLKELPFLRAYRAARRRILEGAIGRLQQAADQAVQALVAALQADRAADRIRAASILLEQGLAGLQRWDLEEELRQLREEVQALKEARGLSSASPGAECSNGSSHARQ